MSMILDLDEAVRFSVERSRPVDDPSERPSAAELIEP